MRESGSEAMYTAHEVSSAINDGMYPKEGLIEVGGLDSSQTNGCKY